MSQNKRPLSAFFIFAADERPNIKLKNPKLSVSEVAKILGEKWRSLSLKDKQTYEAKAKTLKEKYKNAQK